MPTITTGTLGDSNFPAVQTNQIDIDDEIMLLEGSKDLFAPMLQKTKMRAAHGQKSEWLEDEVVPVYTNLSASYLIGATTIAVTSGTGAYFAVNDTIRNELTGENMIVTGIATDTLTVTRGVGSVAAVASSGSADGIIRIANASPQGASYPTVKDTQVVGQFNYQQIIRKSIGLVETARHEDFRGETDPVAYKKNKALLDIVRQQEQAIWLGRRYAGTAATTNHGTQAQLAMGGITDFITTNATASVGTLTQAVWETWLNTKAFGKGPIGGNKLIVMSPLVASAINGFAASKLAIPSVDQNKWGVKITRYQSVLGDVDLFVHPDWRQYVGAAASNNSLGGSAFAIDMSCLYLKGLRPMRWLENRQNPGDDAFIGEYLVEETLVFKQEKRHAKITGITG
jgi:Family of unknown function (DUF5309)